MIFGPIDSLMNIVSTAGKGGVLPRMGSIVYVELAFGFADHSGICLGGSEIVHLNGNGIIEKVSFHEFLEGTTGTKKTIYVSCQDDDASFSSDVAERAENQIGKQREYNFIMDNCHQFVSGCISGNFNNSHNFLWMMKDEAEKVLDVDDWRFVTDDFFDWI